MSWSPQVQGSFFSVGLVKKTNNVRASRTPHLALWLCCITKATKSNTSTERSQMCGASPASERPITWKTEPVHCCFSRNFKQLEGIQSKLGNCYLSFKFYISEYYKNTWLWQKSDWNRWWRFVVKLWYMLWRFNSYILDWRHWYKRKTSLCSKSVWDCHAGWKLTCHIMCVHQHAAALSSERRPQLCVQNQFGLWGVWGGGAVLEAIHYQ